MTLPTSFVMRSTKALSFATSSFSARTSYMLLPLTQPGRSITGRRPRLARSRHAGRTGYSLRYPQPKALNVADDRFVIERLAASGGMGQVYRARDSASGELVAVKVLERGRQGTGPPLAGTPVLERFTREARLLA